MFSRHSFMIRSMHFCAALFVALFVSEARAAKVVFEYSGSISKVFESKHLGQGADPRYEIINKESSTLFPFAEFTIGGLFGGRFGYETTTPLSGISDDGAQAIYFGAVTEISLSAGGYELPSSILPPVSNIFGRTVSIVDNRDDSLDMFQLSQWYSGSDWFSTITISLQDRTMNAINGFDIPIDVSLDKYPSAALFQLAFLNRESGDQLHVQGTLNRLERVSVVAAPQALLLLALGIGVIVFWRGPFSRCVRA